MKKFFLIMAAALVTFSFASCDKKGQNEPETPAQDTTQVEEKVSFEIVVSDLTYTGATVTITPSKDDVTYFWDAVAAEDVEYYGGADKYLAAYVAYYVEQGATYDDFVDGGMIVSGEDYYDFGLDAETDYIVLVCQIDKDLNFVGEVTTKAFSTPARKEGEPFDEYEATEDLTYTFAEYTVSTAYLDTYGTIDISAEDETHVVYLEFNAADDATDLVAGEYPINASGDANTFTASEGLMEFWGYTFITGCYAATLDGEYIDTPWYLVSGTVKVNADGSIEIDALNSANKSVKCTLTTRVEAQEEEEGGEDKAPARKAVRKAAKKNVKKAIRK